MLCDPANRIFVLADGIGGCASGEVASDTAVREAYAYLKDRIIQTTDEESLSRVIIDAVQHAHREVKQRASSDRKLKGMGTTLVILVIKGPYAYVCHVGDSRAYIIRNGIEQITTDHTLENYPVYNSAIAELFLFQKANFPTQAIGLSRKITHELIQLRLQNDDIIILCSDGLTDLLSDEEVADIIGRCGADLDRAAEALINEANNKGGNDNISVVLVRMDTMD